MRYKVAPEPADADRLFAVQDALALVPGRVEDCCARIRDRTDVPTRERARDWLTFLTALGLARETDRGFHRVREDPDREDLAEAYMANVYLARELQDALATAGPLPAADAFEAVRGSVPRWERDRNPDWEAEWRSHVEVLLAWGVVLGPFAEREGRYALSG